jgi:hypothetical protein
MAMAFEPRLAWSVWLLLLEHQRVSKDPLTAIVNGVTGTSLT